MDPNRLTVKFPKLWTLHVRMAVVSEGTITLVGILGSKTGVRGREVKTLIAL